MSGEPTRPDRTGRAVSTYKTDMTTYASKVILRNVTPRAFILWNRALARQEQPLTLNRKARRRVAKVIAQRDRTAQRASQEEPCPKS